MGYSHYWTRPDKLDKEKFAKAANDCKLVTDYLRSKEVYIQFEYDEPEPPVFTDELIRFNGVEGEGHETFYIEREFEGRHTNGKAFAFCKTAFKKYDIAVTACLIVLKHHLGNDIKIESDGTEIDWLAGKDACQSVLSYGEVPKNIKEGY